MQYLDIGTRFGKLVITDLPYKYILTGQSRMKYPCRCDCGGTKDVRQDYLKSGKVSHCGCIRFTKDGAEHKTHNFSGTPIYRSWSEMKQRCLNKNSHDYQNYGGRGVLLDPAWHTFMGFYNDMGETYSEGLSIDRIDVNGNYCKENCRWADDNIQGYNKRFSVRNKSGKTGVSWDGKSKKWRIQFFPPNNQKQISERYTYLWDAIYRRMQLEQQYYGKVKD